MKLKDIHEGTILYVKTTGRSSYSAGRPRPCIVLDKRRGWRVDKEKTEIRPGRMVTSHVIYFEPEKLDEKTGAINKSQNMAVAVQDQEGFWHCTVASLSALRLPTRNDLESIRIQNEKWAKDNAEALNRRLRVEEFLGTVKSEFGVNLVAESNAVAEDDDGEVYGDISISGYSESGSIQMDFETFILLLRKAVKS